MCRQKCVFLFTAVLLGDVLRQPKQCRDRQDVIESEGTVVTLGRGATFAQFRAVRLCRP